MNEGGADQEVPLREKIPQEIPDFPEPWKRNITGSTPSKEALRHMGSAVLEGVFGLYKFDGRNFSLTLSEAETRPEDNNIFFKLSIADPITVAKHYKPGIEMISLIKDIEFKEDFSEEAKAALKRRVTEHNTAKLIKYLKSGGDPSILPATTMLPKQEIIDELLQKLP